MFKKSLLFFVLIFTLVLVSVNVFSSEMTFTNSTPIITSYPINTDVELGIIISDDDGISKYIFSHFNQTEWVNDTEHKFSKLVYYTGFEEGNFNCSSNAYWVCDNANPAQSNVSSRAYAGNYGLAIKDLDSDGGIILNASKFGDAYSNGVENFKMEFYYAASRTAASTSEDFDIRDFSNHLNRFGTRNTAAFYEYYDGSAWHTSTVALTQDFVKIVIWKNGSTLNITIADSWSWQTESSSLENLRYFRPRTATTWNNNYSIDEIKVFDLDLNLSEERVFIYNASVEKTMIFGGIYNYTWYGVDDLGITAQSDYYSLDISEYPIINNIYTSPIPYSDGVTELDCNFNVTNNVGGNLNLSVTWYKNDININTYDYIFEDVTQNITITTTSVTGSVTENLVVGDNWSCNITVGDGVFNASEGDLSTTVLETKPTVVIDIIPQTGDTVSAVNTTISWVENNDSGRTFGYPDTPYNISVVLNNESNEYTLTSTIPNGTLSYIWNTSQYGIGLYNLTFYSCNIYGCGENISVSNILINTIPIVSSYTIPLNLYNNDTLEGWVAVNDTNEHNQNYSYVWYKNDIVFNNGINNLNIYYDICYQETATEATACGGLATGNYSAQTGSWSFNPAFGWDGLYDADDGISFAGAQEVNSLSVYYNYSKPVYAVMEGSYWLIQFGDATPDITIHNMSNYPNCWNQEPLQFKGTSTNLAGSVGDTSYGYCWNGTTWQTIVAFTGPSQHRMYEEAMYWAIPTMNINNISSSDLNVYDNWTFSVRSWDGYDYSDWSNSSVNSVLNRVLRNLTIYSPDNNTLSNQNLSVLFSIIDEDEGINCSVNTNISSVYLADKECYQETPTVSTSCGGLNTGTISVVDGSPSNPTNMYDGNFGSYGTSTTSISYLYANYTKPVNAINVSWKTQDEDGTHYFLISEESNPYCWNYSDSFIYLAGLSRRAPATFPNEVWWQCYNGTGWAILQKSTANSRLYEEAVIWGMSTISSGVKATIEVPLESDGIYNWNLSCISEGDITPLYSENSVYTYDTTSPLIDNESYATDDSWLYPQIGDTFHMNATVYDLNNVSYCKLMMNDTGVWENKTTYTVLSQNTTIEMSYVIQTYSTDNVSGLGWNIWCNDTAGNDVEGEIQNFTVKDVTFPLIIAGPNNFINGSIHSNYLYNVTYDMIWFDYNLFQASVNVSCELNGTIYYWENLDINTSTYNKTDIIDIGGLSLQKCTLYSQTSDDHTKKKWKAKKINYEEQGIMYETPEDINFRIVTDTKAKDIEDIKSIKKEDRESFRFEFSNKKKERNFIITTNNKELFYIDESEYASHFVAWNYENSKGVWFDLDTKNITYNKLSYDDYDKKDQQKLDKLNEDTQETFDKVPPVNPGLFASEKEKEQYEKDLKKYNSNLDRYNRNIVNAWDKYNEEVDKLDRKYNSEKKKEQYIVTRINDYQYNIKIKSDEPIYYIEFNSLGGTNVENKSWEFYIGGTVNTTSLNIYDNSTFDYYFIDVAVIDAYPAVNRTITIYGSCYQEYTNVNTTCGGLSTGTSLVTGLTWSNTSVPIDGVWNVPTADITGPDGNATLFSNYTLPPNTIEAEWKASWQNGSGTYNATYNLSTYGCLKYPVQVKVDSNAGVGGETVGLYHSCNDGSGWVILGYYVGQFFDEEGITWYFDTDKKFVTDLSNGTYEFKFYHDDYFNQTYTVVVGESLEQRIYETYQSIVNMFFTNIKTGLVVSNAVVTITNNNSNQTNQATTDGDGGVVFYINASDYAVLANGTDLLDYTDSFSVTTKENLTLNYIFYYYANFTLYDESTLGLFDTNSAEAITLIIECVDRTEQYNINLTNPLIPINCDYRTFKFVLDYGDALGNYYRTYILEADDTDIWLLNLNTTDAIYNNFRIDDLMNDYNNPRIYITKTINEAEEIITSAYVDIEDKIGAYLMLNHQYHVRVVSDNQPDYIVGDYSAASVGDKVIRLYDVGVYPGSSTQNYINDVSLYASYNISNDVISFLFDDVKNYTSSITYTVYNGASSDGDILFTSTVDVSDDGNYAAIITGLNLSELTVAFEATTVRKDLDTTDWAKIVNAPINISLDIIQHLGATEDEQFQWLNLFFIILLGVLMMWAPIASSSLMAFVVVLMVGLLKLFNLIRFGLDGTSVPGGDWALIGFLIMIILIAMLIEGKKR